MTTTSGPWTLYYHPPYPDIMIEHRVPADQCVSAYNQGICDMSQFECRARPEEAMANARLIAAAPEIRDLLAAYLKTATDHDPNRDLAYCDARARALLARIEGKE